MTITTGAATTVTTTAAVTVGLLSGMYLAFSVAVMPALHRRPAVEAAATMRAINRSIVGPLFGSLFAVSGLAAAGAVAVGIVEGRPLAVAGGALGLLGGHLITAAVNVPLNTALDRATDLAAGWQRFERPWVRAHTCRTALTAAGAVLLAL